MSAIVGPPVWGRSLRHEILSYHIIFHWNRLGISARQQSILAASARATILGLPAAPASSRLAVRPNTAPAPPSAETLAGLDRAMMRFEVPRTFFRTASQAHSLGNGLGVEWRVVGVKLRGRAYRLR